MLLQAALDLIRQLVEPRTADSLPSFVYDLNQHLSFALCERVQDVLKGHAFAPILRRIQTDLLLGPRECP